MTKTVLITGASSGLGAALSRFYAREGANLYLVARNADRLAKVAEDCLKEGASFVEAVSLDVSDARKLSDWIMKADQSNPIDLLIANAGITGGTASDGKLETGAQSLELLSTNVLGMAAAVNAILPAMTVRRGGQIGVVSSIVAFLPLGGLPSYSASKAANLAYALSLRETLRPYNIGVSAICPGYVDTPLLRQLESQMPTLISPARAAAIVAHGLVRNRRIIAFPKLYAAWSRILGLLPGRLSYLLAPSVRLARPRQEE